MHRGCFVWTLTPPPAGRRTPRRGPVRVCVCLSVLAGLDGRDSRARSGAPGLYLWPLCLSALLRSLQAGVAPCVVLCLRSPAPFCFFFPSFFFPAPPLSPAFFGFRPRAPWALALCGVCYVGRALFGSPCGVASFVLPASPLAALWWLPPPFCVSRFLLPPLGALHLVFFSSPFPRPRCLWLSLVSSPGCPRPWRCALWFFFCLPPLRSLCALA